MAHLRMERGNPGFIDECGRALCRLTGVDGVLSPPLPASAQSAWRHVGFDVYASLRLMRRELGHPPPPDHLVAAGDLSDLNEALRIDSDAFDEFWRFDRTAMLEALTSTSRSAMHVVRRPGGGLAGFAITGMGVAISYLQRVAVDPRWQGRGIGRSLVRTSARWAERQGARAIVLNTPVGNRTSTSLYESEEFRLLDEGLAVLHRSS
jgi:ribosomal protein S18 acetylase RimI-like enzyme